MNLRKKLIAGVLASAMIITSFSACTCAPSYSEEEIDSTLLSEPKSTYSYNYNDYISADFNTFNAKINQFSANLTQKLYATAKGENFVISPVYPCGNLKRAGRYLRRISRKLADCVFIIKRRI